MGDDRLKVPDRLTLVRPDGTTLQASAEQARKLALLGYKEESNYAGFERARETGREEYYTSGGQQALAGVEGLGRGLTLGATDALFGDEDTQARTEFNPGTAMAGELVGALAPALASLGGGSGALAKVLAKTPSALLTEGAIGATKGIGSTVGKMAAAGAIEGAVAGGASAIDHAYLSGDPLTASAVMAGLGWGTLFGAGAGAIAGKLQSSLAKKAAEASPITKLDDLVHEVSPSQIVDIKPARLLDESAPHFSNFRKEVVGLDAEITRSVANTNLVLEEKITELAQSAKARLVDEIGGPLHDELIGSLKAIQKAQASGDPVAIEEALARVKKAFSGDKMSLDIAAGQGIPGAQKLDTTDPSQVLRQLTEMRAVGDELKNFPQSIESFAKLSPDKAEKLFATMEQAGKFKDFATVTASIDDAAKAMSASLGIEEAGIGELRKVWTASKAMMDAPKMAAREAKLAAKEAAMEAKAARRAEKLAEKEQAIKEAHSNRPGLLARGIGMVAGATAASKVAMAGGKLAAAGAYVTTKSAVSHALTPGKLAGARNSVLARLSAAADSFKRSTVKALSTGAARLQPLSLALDGTVENSKKSAEDLAALRIDEFAKTAQGINDTLYAAIEPMAGTQPSLAPALHKAAVERFNKFRAMLPADPGVVSGLKSVWKPTALQAATMARQYEVFLDPVGATERMLASGNYDPIRINALKELDPPLFQHFRATLLEKVTQKDFMSKMSFNEQMGLGALLDIPIHSSMRPEFIAASLQLHTKRKETTQSPVQQTSNSGGRPASDSSMSTAAQKTTDR